MRFKCPTGQHRFQTTVLSNVVSNWQKEHRFNHVPQIPAKQPISLKVLFDSTGYMVRTLLCSKVDKLTSWDCKINYNGNLKAGRLNKIPDALQTNGLQ